MQDWGLKWTNSERLRKGRVEQDLEGAVWINKFSPIALWASTLFGVKIIEYLR